MEEDVEDDLEGVERNEIGEGWRNEQGEEVEKMREGKR